MNETTHLPDMPALSHPSLVDGLFDSAWYLEQYNDVADQQVDPASHYRDWGAAEGRAPNHLFDVPWYRAFHSLSPKDDVIRHYVESAGTCRNRPNAIFDPQFVQSHYQLAKDQDPVEYALVHQKDIDRVSTWFSRSEYLLANPDVADGSIAPELHFIRYGIKEARSVGPRYDVRSAKTLQTSESRLDAVDSLTVGGVNYYVFSLEVPADISDQVIEQALIDPDVVASGLRSVPFIRTFHATDIERRDLVSYRALLDAIPIGVQAVVITSALRVGGAEKYCADLIAGLREKGIASTVVVTTESTQAEDAAALSYSILSAIRGTRVASIFELVRNTWKKDNILALLLMRASPKYLFIVNSDLGLAAVAKYGLALRGVMKIYCAFFSESPFAEGSPYSARYLRNVIPHSFVISDNLPALTTFKERVAGNASADRLKLLPNRISLPSPRRRAALDKARLEAARKSRPRVLWLSRWEKFKAVDVVVETARMALDLDFDIYGPIQEHVDLDSIPPNINFWGPVPHPSSLAIQHYDVFLFTSYFEGMPNVVLEMAAAGIPIVASNVGGLRHTFRNDSITLVDMDGGTNAISQRFSIALYATLSLPRGEVMDRIERARAAVTAAHGADAYELALGKLLNAKNDWHA